MRNAMQISPTRGLIHLFHKAVGLKIYKLMNLKWWYVDDAHCPVLCLFGVCNNSTLTGIMLSSCLKAGYLFKYLSFYEGESRVHCVMYNKISLGEGVEGGRRKKGKDNTVK